MSITSSNHLHPHPAKHIHPPYNTPDTALSKIYIRISRMQQYFFKRLVQKFMKYWSLSLIYKSSQIKDHSSNNRSENSLRITLNRLFVLGEIWVKVKYKELKVRKSIANSRRTAVLSSTARAHNLLISDKSSDHKVGDISRTYGNLSISPSTWEYGLSVSACRLPTLVYTNKNLIVEKSWMNNE